MQDRTAMVVLGMHRSGTSAMAGALATSGFQPPSTQMPPRPENPAGYWESPVVSDLNDEILAAQDASWDDIFPIDETSLLSNFGVFFVGKAADVLTAEFGDAQRIVLKDPRICLLANVWKRALHQQGFRTHFVLVVRHPGEVAASLARRNEFSRDKSLLLWLSNMISAERKTRGESRSIVLFDDLLADPQSVLDRIEADFGQPLPRRTRMAELAVERVVDQGLRSHAHGDRPHRRGELNSLAAQAYEGFQAAARGHGPDEALFDGLARRLAEIEALAGGVVSELRLHAHQLNARIRQDHAEAQALAHRVAALEPLAAEAGRVEALQAELDSERTSVRALHAQASELTLAAGEAARSLEQQRETARAEAEALAQELASERQAAEQRLSELEGLRNDLAREAEQRAQLQQAHDAATHGLGAQQAAAEAARRRAEDLERLLTHVREDQVRDQDAHREQIEQLTREIAAERVAASSAQARAQRLEDLLAQAREQTGEVERLTRGIDAERAAASAAQAEARRLEDRLDQAREEAARQQAEHRSEIDGLNERLQAATEGRAALERDAAQSADRLSAAEARSQALAAELAQERLGRIELAEQATGLRTALARAKVEASEAVAAMEKRVAERDAHLAASREALNTALAAERGEGARIRNGLKETVAALTVDLEGERSAMRLMVGDLVRVTSELEVARREAAELRQGVQTDRAELASLRSQTARIEAQAAQRLDKEMNHSGALAAELESVKQMLAYLTTRWWWRAMSGARRVVGGG